MGLGPNYKLLFFIMGLRGDLRLIERAIRQCWETPPAKQKESYDLIFSTLENPNATSREKLAALRCIDALIQHDGATDPEIKKRIRDAERHHIAKAGEIAKADRL